MEWLQLVPEEMLRFMAESCGQQLITETREMVRKKRESLFGWEHKTDDCSM